MRPSPALPRVPGEGGHHEPALLRASCCYQRPGARTDDGGLHYFRPRSVRRMASELMDAKEVNRFLIGKITEIGVRYDFGEEHELLGWQGWSGGASTS